MARLCPSLPAACCVATLALGASASAATYDYTFNALTYTIVEPDPFVAGGTAGNTIDMNHPSREWAQTVGGNLRGLYSYRNFGGLGVWQPPGTLADARDLYELGNNAQPPDLRTTVSGLASGTYDVFLLHMVRPDNPGAGASLAADIDTGQSKPSTNRNEASPGIIVLVNPAVAYVPALQPLGQITGTSFSVLVGHARLHPGDFDENNWINQDDLTRVLSNWEQAVDPGDRTRGDAVADGFIDSADLNAVTNLANWGRVGYPAGVRGDYIGLAYKLVAPATSVPEPSTIALLGVGVLGVATVRRRHAKQLAATSFAALLILGASAPAPAAITGAFVPVTTEATLSPPTGFLTHDLMADASTDWLASNMRVVLTGGTIYQNTSAPVTVPAAQKHAPPDPANFDAIPDLRWDTYVQTPAGATAQSAGTFLTDGGAAVDLGGANTFAFSTSAISVNWYTTSTTDTGMLKLGRFTLSDTAQGTWLLRLDSVDQTAPFLLSGFVKNGQFVVPPENFADFDGDTDVDGNDYLIWQRNLGSWFVMRRFTGDANGDYAVDGADLTVLKSGFGTPAVAAAAAVPEPQSIALLAAGVALTGARRCRRMRPR